MELFRSLMADVRQKRRVNWPDIYTIQMNNYDYWKPLTWLHAYIHIFNYTLYTLLLLVIRVQDMHLQWVTDPTILGINKGIKTTEIRNATAKVTMSRAQKRGCFSSLKNFGCGLLKWQWQAILYYGPVSCFININLCRNIFLYNFKIFSHHNI